MSQDGTLCIWESNTELDGLRKGPKYSERQKMAKERQKLADSAAAAREDGDDDDDIEEIMENDGQPRAEVIKGSVDAPKEVKGIRNVRYKQRSK